MQQKYALSLEFSSNGNTLDELEKLNLKPFHPVTNVYAVGLVVDGKDIITARPYNIYPIEQTIDFVSTMVQRENKEQFGDFEFQSVLFERGRKWAWKKIKNGSYKMIPKTGLTDIEEVRVNYLDKTTNEVHTIICQFQTLLYLKGHSKLVQYGFIPNTEDDILKAYRYISQNGTENNVLSLLFNKDGISIPSYSNKSIDNYITVQEGLIKPPTTGTYVFAARSTKSSLFYLSETPLKNDPDLDSDKLIIHQPTKESSYDNAIKSKEIELDSTKSYYFRHIIFMESKESSSIGYKLNNEGNFNTIPSNWVTIKKLTEKDEEFLFNNQFKPDFERIYGMDVWDGRNLLNNPQDKWEIYKFPKGDSIKYTNKGEVILDNSNPKEIVSDNDETTEYRTIYSPESSSIPFPHIFEIDLGQQQSFNMIKLKGPRNENFYGMKSYLKIYVAQSNSTDIIEDDENENETTEYPSSINQEKSLVWEGLFESSKTTQIFLENEIEGRYMKLVFINNSKRWRNNFPGGTAISIFEVGRHMKAKKIYPMTNTRYLSFKNKWDEYRGGAYYNGKGFTGYSKDESPTKDGGNSILTIKIPRSKTEIGIIGDYYPEMGTAVVKIDGEEVGKIGPGMSVDLKNDTKKLTLAKRSYKSLLFYYTSIDPKSKHELTIEVTKGQITLAGILVEQMIVDYFNDNGTYEYIIEHEFDEPEEPIEPNTTEPIPNPSLVTPIPNDIVNLPIINIESGATIFEFTEDGFTSNETLIDKTSSSIKTITFTEREIKITESGFFNSSIPVYLVSTYIRSTIEIDKNLNNSNIGIYSTRSPVIKTSTNIVPLSLLNNITSGSIRIDVPEVEEENGGKIIDEISLKEVHNYQGKFTLYVPYRIESIKISTLSLFNESKFEIVAEDDNSRQKVITDFISEDDVIITSEKLINIASNTKSTLKNILIQGTLVVNDDSELTLNSKSQFLNKSEIIVVVHHSKTYDDDQIKKPIINCIESLNSIPSQIVLMTQNKDETIDVSNLTIIGSRSFPDCEKLSQNVFFQIGRKGEISANCNKTDGLIYLSVNAKEFKDDVVKKKSNIGLIVGVTVGCVVVVAVIVVVVIILIRRKNKKQRSDDEEQQVIPVHNSLI